jgi:hypothetical protein
MTRSHVELANAKRLASEQLTRVLDGESYDEHFQHVVATPVGVVPRPLGLYLLAASSPDLAVDGSTTAVSYDLEPGSDDVYRVHRLTLLAQLSGAPTVSQFGNIAALTNGLLLEIVDPDDETIDDLLGSQPIRSNLDLATLGTVSLETFGASYMLRSVIDFPVPLRLVGDEHILRATVQDNITLTRLRLFAQGTTEAFE